MRRRKYTLWDEISLKYYIVRDWLRWHLFSRHFYRKIGILLRGRPWDFWGLYEIEKATIEEMSECIGTCDRYFGVEYDVRDMNLAVKLLEVVKDEADLFHFEKPDVEPEPVNGRRRRFIPGKYVCDVYVNTKNVKRFARNDVEEKLFLKYPHDLYVEKARHLYHKIRCERDINWAD